jgi:glycosyltransferase involved in cell wall biosynthesis
MKISAVIIAFNEEANIADAILTVDWADEVLVIDSESTDGTRDIAGSLGARVIVEKWRGFAKQKQFAVEHAMYDRILSIDADERVSEPLKTEILRIRDLDRVPDGYRIPRLAVYMGRQIRHGGWYPDWQLRFFDRRRGRWKDVLIHESFVMQPGCTVEHLKGDLIHYTVESAAEHDRMIVERYAPLAARQMFELGKRTNRLKIATAGCIAFLSTYVLRMGFLDGFEGYIIARFSAHHAFLKHVILWQLQRSQTLVTK